MNGTSWLLGGGYPWHSAEPAGAQPGADPIVAAPLDGLSLAPLSGGPLGLASTDGSLGRLTLPRGLAVDGETVLVLSTDGSRVFRYDSVRATLTALAAIGAEGLDPNPPAAAFDEPRRFRGASNIAAHGGALYVADSAARRVQVFDHATGALLQIHGGLGDPADVAAGQRGVYILDRATARLYRTSPWSDSLEVVVDVPARRGRWQRLAIDREERVYLLDKDASPPALDVVVPAAPAIAIAERLTSSTQARSRFGAADIYIDARGGIVLPERLLDPCGLRRPPGPHVRRWRVGDRFYVIDAESRVVGVHLEDGRLRHRFGPYDAAGIGVPFDTPEGWSPVDLAVVDNCVLVLDERHQIVYAHRLGAETLQQWFSAPADLERTWRRLAHDGTGCLLLWDGIGDAVDRVDQRGRMLEQVSARAARRHFARPSDATNRAPDRPAVRLTRGGAVPRPPGEPPEWPEPAFKRHGVWTSRWLDSDLYDCQWHVLELAVRQLPPGSRIRVRTRTSNEKQSDAEVSASLGTVGALGSWRDTPALEGPPQPDARQSAPSGVDVLVPSPPGQYIQLQVELTGDGVTSPVLDSLRLRFPRESLLEYLPAIYSKPEEQREFLDRFLSIMQTTWAAIEREVDTFERYLDPDSVPPEAMAYLAGWLDLQLEGTWKDEQNRRLLQAMPALRDRWGTAAGLQAWLRVYLANLGGATSDQLEAAGIPGIVEGFVERRRLQLNRAGAAALCAADGLWSPSVERRFQVGVFDREGEVELVSEGDPDVDLFRHYAHSFRVYVPAVWIRTPDAEALVRRAIELQKPAHTTYELVLVEPRFRIGVQSTIALDTVIGAPLPGPLLCPTVNDAPGRPLYQRLGFDTTLGCGSGAPRGLERRLD
jgi:phage tail-like protein